ncbi:MAG: C_GCAxxG_C_C family protein [Desulfarculus sp.]|jgi:C_GCAxxG_C_C family probable redox protein|nr:MAG: C_GCAxxG_C_C family protein [Desulfarculus sp.]
MQELLEKAERLALENRSKGFHCSESVFAAINETLGIIDPEMVRIATGFHGGGGARRKDKEVDLTVFLEEVASGRERRPPDQWPVEVTGHICGALASGVMCIGLLFGRRKPTDDLTCPDELANELHRRFEEKFGTKLCREIRQKYVPISDNHTCEYVYQKGARMAVELILSSPSWAERCPNPRLTAGDR